MKISTGHKLLVIPTDPLLDSERDDNKRDLLSLHAIGNPSDMILVAASSESKVRAIRVGRMFSLEISPANLIAGDTVSVECGGGHINMIVISASPLINEVK